MSISKGLEWTFNTEVQKYDKMRPGYVPELYDDVLHYAPVGQSSRVVEVGIGSGQATLPVLQTGCRLIAVEYGANLAELCRRKFKNYPGFSAVTAKFEDFHCEKDSCDLIYSATAFHWIPEEIGYQKVFDMLKSGGGFARFANHPYRDKREGLWQTIQSLYDIYMPCSRTPAEYGQDKAQALADIAKKYGFVDTCCKLYHRTRTFTAKEYTSLLGTYSDHIALEENTRKKFFAEIETAIHDFGGQITIYDTIDLQLARKP